MAETINIRIPDQLNLGQYKINVGDTVEFIEKMTGTQTDLDTFSAQSNMMAQDVQLAANQIGVRWGEILAVGLQVDTDKGIVTQLRAETNADKILAQNAATAANISAMAAHEDSVIAQNAAIATNADKIQTSLDRAATEAAASAAENDRERAETAADNAETSEISAAEWAQLILEAGIGGFATLTYEQRGLLRSLNPEDVVQTLVAGLGLFSYDATADLLDDDMTYFKAAVGGWRMSVPATDTVMAIIDTIARQEVTGRFVTGEAYCAIVNIAAASSVSFTAPIFGIEESEGVIVAPPADLPSISILGRATYNQVTITLTNASADTVAIPAEARGFENPWTITVIKKGDKL